MSRTDEDIEPILQYLEAQCSKGLVDYIQHNVTSYCAQRYRIGYSTHWGTHQEVIKPEIMHIVAQNNMRFHDLFVREDGFKGGWINECDVMWVNAATYVEVGMYMEIST